MRKHFVAAVFTILGMAAVAQQTPPPKPQFSWVATQAPEIQQLSDALAGEWKTTEKFEANELLKSGGAGSGIFSIRKGPGGNSLILDYTSQGSIGPYSSSRIIYWDGREGHYRAFYCDSLQPNGCGKAGADRCGKAKTLFSSRPLRGLVVPSK